MATADDSVMAPRLVVRAAFAGLVSVLLLLAVSLASPARSESILRIVPHADLKNIDPIWTTAYITRNHGYMVYDTLFALDENLEVQPQMVDRWSVSEDGLIWRFVLRDGLRWHDGAPVTAADCVASIRRWSARDGMGQKLADATRELRVIDATTFELELGAPYGLVLESLGKISSNVPFMMPERHASMDPFEQIPDTLGSGPFIFVKDEWIPGARVVYVRNPDYVPRAEPSSFAAGAKRARVDRVEWHYIPDSATAMNALMAGEVDYFELPPHDLLPILEAASGVVVENLDPLGVQGWLRMNHLHPPFDDPRVREAVLWLIDQEHYMRAAVGNPAYYQTCPAMLACGTPFESTVGSDALVGHDIDKARELIAAAGYEGAPVTILQPTDIAILNSASLVTAQALRDAGFVVDLQAMDWSTLTSRRPHHRSAGAGRLEPVPYLGARRGRRQPGRQHRDFRRLPRTGLVRMAVRRRDRTPARHFCPHFRARPPEDPGPGDPGPGLRGCHAWALRTVVKPGRVPRFVARADQVPGPVFLEHRETGALILLRSRRQPARIAPRMAFSSETEKTRRD